MTLDEFKSRVETFISENEIAPTAFGKRFAGDPLFVFQLRDGREPREATRERVLAGMSHSALNAPNKESAA